MNNNRDTHRISHFVPQGTMIMRGQKKLHGKLEVMHPINEKWLDY